MEDQERNQRNQQGDEVRNDGALHQGGTGNGGCEDSFERRIVLSFTEIKAE